MHTGSFPTGGKDNYRRGQWTRQQLEAGAPHSRRAWLIAAVGFAAGAATGAFGGGALAGTRAATTPRPPREPAAPPAIGSLAWAQSLRSAPLADLIHWSGELERVSMRDRTATELIPLFARLLRGVLQRPQLAHADAAGAVAARSLARLGAVEELATFGPMPSAAPLLPDTRTALHAAQARVRTREVR